MSTSLPLRLLIFSLIALAGAGSATAQTISSLSTPLATPSGERSSIAELGHGKVTVVVFWMTSCQPSKHELEALQEISTAMGNSVAVVAISIDNTKTMAKVGPLVRSKGYTFPVLLDPNSDLFNGLNGQDHPYTLIFNAAGALVERWGGFLQGDGLKLTGAVRAAGTGSPPGK
jgi:thiol-disulfide isomerase/thioredoxin